MRIRAIAFVLCGVCAGCGSASVVSNDSSTGAASSTVVEQSSVATTDAAALSSTSAPESVLEVATIEGLDGKESALSGTMVERDGCVGITNNAGEAFWPVMFVGLTALDVSTDPLQGIIKLPRAEFPLGTEMRLTGGWDSIENIRSTFPIAPVVPESCPQTGQYFLTNRAVGGRQAWRAS
jgi:hypothetical protein